MIPFDWTRLNKQQLGKYGEYFAKMEFTMHGFEVYTTEVDYRCIDFITRWPTGKYHAIQVKSIRIAPRKSNYVYMPKETFRLDDDILLALVMFGNERTPHCYLIPAKAWLEPNDLLTGRDYSGLKSKPEWGLSLNSKTKEHLEQYAFEKTFHSLIKG